MGRDDAGVRTTQRHAAAPRDHPAVGDDRAGSLVGRVRAVVEDLRLPHRLARRRVDRVDVVVGAVVDDQVAVDGDVAVGGDREEVVVEVVREVATVLPPSCVPGIIARDQTMRRSPTLSCVIESSGL